MKSEICNWSDIRVFLAVMRHGSTLAASNGLGLAQPTVARRIDALEHETGLTLFERDTRGFRPTEAARQFLPLAEDMERAAQGIADFVSNMHAVKPIRLTAYAGNFSPRVMDVFSAFSVEHPDIPIELIPSVKVVDLMTGEADIALRLSRAIPAPELIQRYVSTAEFAFFAARRYVEENGNPRDQGTYRGHKFLTFKRDDVPQYMHATLQRLVSPDQIINTYTEIDLLHAGIRAGNGLGIVNIRYAEGIEDLVQCSDPIDELASQHLILISPEAYRRPEVKTFVKFFAPRYAAIFK